MLTERELAVLRGKMIPQAQKADFFEGRCRLRDGIRFVVPAGSGDVVRRLSVAYWGMTPEVAEEAAETGGEEYTIQIGEDSVAITGHVRYAMQTLRQLAEPERGVERFTFYFLPLGRIEDAPAMGFRGMHLCCFPENSLWEIEKQIRLAAYYKFNYVVLEPWGTFPFQSHPELAWKGHTCGREEWKRLIDLAYELGITPIPQFNLLGHATASRVSSGKHAVLDFNPALQSLFEPDGWTWCLSNPVVRQIQEDIVCELHEFFGMPEFFHIGYDEAYSIGTCADCRSRDLAVMVEEHIKQFHGLLAGRNCRPIMWHDMLFNQEDSRWKGCIVCGHAANGLGELYKKLPRDILIADWQYHFPEEIPIEERWATTRFLKEAGFDVVVCPWHREGGTYSLGQLAIGEKLAGMLATTWHFSFGSYLHSIFMAGAQSSWCGVSQGDPDRRTIMNFHMRHVGWDMKISEYEKTGVAKLQISRAPFPG